MPEPQRIDRREFAKQITSASGAVATLLVADAQITAADEPKPEKPKAASDDAQESKPAAVPPKRPSEEVLLLNLLITRYPSEHFDETTIKGILSDLRGDIGRGRILSECGLQNSDEPCAVFRAYRGPE